MNRGESVEVLVGVTLVGVGLAGYVGWEPVCLGLGSLMVIGAVASWIARWRSAV